MPTMSRASRPSPSMPPSADGQRGSSWWAARACTPACASATPVAAGCPSSPFCRRPNWSTTSQWRLARLLWQRLNQLRPSLLLVPGLLHGAGAGGCAVGTAAPGANGPDVGIDRGGPLAVPVEGSGQRSPHPLPVRLRHRGRSTAPRLPAASGFRCGADRPALRRCRQRVFRRWRAPAARHGAAGWLRGFRVLLPFRRAGSRPRRISNGCSGVTRDITGRVGTGGW